MNHRIALAALAFAAAQTSAAGAAPLLGFSPAGADAERALEAKFDAGLSAGAIDARLKTLSAEPNEVGSPHDKANAEFVLAQFKAWGWDAHIETFEVLYPTPKHELLEMVGPDALQGPTQEPPIPGDACSDGDRARACRPTWSTGRRRCHRRAGLCQLWHAGRLQRLGAAGRGREGQDRHRPLRPGWRGLKVKQAL